MKKYDDEYLNEIAEQLSLEESKKILQIEENLKDEIYAIKEILDMVVKNKQDLEDMKKIHKEKLKELLNDDQE